MYCMNCGAFVSENASYCLNCGAMMPTNQQGGYYPNSNQSQGYPNGYYSGQNYSNYNMTYSQQMPVSEQKKIEYPDKEVAGVVFGIFSLVFAVFSFIFCWIPFFGSIIGAIMAVISIVISLIVKAVLENVKNNATFYSRKVNAGNGLTTASLIISGIVIAKAVITFILYIIVIIGAGQTGGATP